VRLRYTQPPKTKDIAACGIAGVLDLNEKPIKGKVVRDMISLQRERENGLGGGYAAYGLFPKRKDEYCIQLLLEDIEGCEPTKERVAELLKTQLELTHDEEIKTEKTPQIPESPQTWRFFVESKAQDPDEEIKNTVMSINANVDGAFCMSSGKNMAVFKGNGYAEDIGHFYKIRDMKAALNNSPFAIFMFHIIALSFRFA